MATLPRTSERALAEAALGVLNAADPVEKARLGEAAASDWLQGVISVPYHENADLPVPDRPVRLSDIRLVAPQLMPKLGKAGSLQSRQAILHSLVHTESWAIDLSWDIIARFGKRECMPREFFTDFVNVARDEGRHFTLLSNRLRDLGSYYGALPAHDGLWDSATATSGNLLARLAVEHCVHEARGLDVLPTTISRFRKGGDDQTADLLENVVYPEEITHCAAGIKWFKYLCLRESCGSPAQNLSASSLSLENSSIEEDLEKPVARLGTTKSGADQDIQNGNVIDHDELDRVILTFHETVRKYFRGPLKPPFNEQARRTAGFGPRWYEPLAVKFSEE